VNLNTLTVFNACLGADWLALRVEGKHTCASHAAPSHQSALRRCISLVAERP